MLFYLKVLYFNWILLENSNLLYFRNSYSWTRVVLSKLACDPLIWKNELSLLVTPPQRWSRERDCSFLIVPFEGLLCSWRGKGVESFQIKKAQMKEKTFFLHIAHSLTRQQCDMIVEMSYSLKKCTFVWQDDNCNYKRMKAFKLLRKTNTQYMIEYKKCVLHLNINK